MAIVDVSQSVNIAVSILDPVARAALGSDCVGVSNRRGTSVIHVEDSGQNVAIANSLFTAWNTLLIGATQSSIDADGVDTSILTHSTPDAAMDYYVWLDGADYAFGEVTAIAGVVTLNLSTDVAGTYTVLLARKAGNYASGISIIEAMEA